MSKNVAVFVDVANIFYAAKAAGVDIDYVTLLKAAIAGRDFVRAYAYTGLDPENENQRQFHSFLARNGYKVVSKDIRKYGDGRIKANLDIELVVDMMKLSRNLDVAVVISGDGDFAPAIRAVQEMGVRVEVISFRGNTSSDLIEAADVFTDIIQLARVETGSSRSGRRVAAEGDLSMTEVPDKETEGAARRRGGRGRGERGGERQRTGTRDRGTDRIPVAEPAPSRANGAEVVGLPGNLIVLPGEKLSRAPRGGAAAAGDAGRTPFDELEELDEIDELDEEATDGIDEAVSINGVAADGALGMDDAGAEGRRRRRRRGGRGRGRGRGTEQELAAEATTVDATGEVADDEDDEDHEELEEPETIRMPQHSTFGSVWDSQLGVPTQPILPTGELGDDEFEDEPEIPEYLLAERRQRGQVQRGRGGPPGRMGGRMGGGRNAGYQSAVDRERYGRGGAPSTGSPFGAPRRDDRGGRPAPRPDRDRQGGRGGQGDRGPRQQRPDRPMRDERPVQRQEPSGPVSGDPWTEVPPELEEMLRAELARKIGGGAPSRDEPRRTARATSATTASEADEPEETAGAAPAAATGRRRATGTRGTAATRRRAATDEEPVSAGAEPIADQPTADAKEAAAPSTARRTAPRRRTAETSGEATGDGSDGMTGGPATSSGTGDPGTAEVTAEAAPRRRGRKPAVAASAEVPAALSADAPASPAKRPRGGRRPAGTPEAPATAGAAGGASGSSDGAAAGATAGDDGAATPRRRTRRTTEALPSDS